MFKNEEEETQIEFSDLNIKQCYSLLTEGIFFYHSYSYGVFK